ncbi:MAG: hypothetical protein ACLSAP_05570 [Oscillospiraceae bacterium]
MLCLVISIASIAGRTFAGGIEEKDYGVFYTCGSTWRKCLWVDVLQSLLPLAVPMMSGACGLQYRAKRRQHLLTKRCISRAAACGGDLLAASAYGFQVSFTKQNRRTV